MSEKWKLMWHGYNTRSQCRAKIPDIKIWKELRFLILDLYMFVELAAECWMRMYEMKTRRLDNQDISCSSGEFHYKNIQRHAGVASPSRRVAVTSRRRHVTSRRRCPALHAFSQIFVWPLGNNCNKYLPRFIFEIRLNWSDHFYFRLSLPSQGYK